MINGLGIVGWGVGGIEAEAGMLGQPVYFLTPDVVGVHLTGALGRRHGDGSRADHHANVCARRKWSGNLWSFLGRARRLAGRGSGDDCEHGAGVWRHDGLLPDR